MDAKSHGGFLTGKRYRWGDRELTVMQWFREPEALKSGVTLDTLSTRFVRGWSAQRAVTTPTRSKNTPPLVPHDSRKATIYLPPELAAEVEAEAKRLGWPASRVVQSCIAKVMPKIRALPSHDFPESSP